jgi:hypothetical protein
MGHDFQLYFAPTRRMVWLKGGWGVNETVERLEDAMMVPEEIFRSCCRNFIRF